MDLFDVYPIYDIAPVKGNGMWVSEEDGTAYLDLYGGHAVISIGHSHPHYQQALRGQLDRLGFYSNSVKNPLQRELAEKLEVASGCRDYQLFLCNSGAEANENALKLASFHTDRSRVICFEQAFHGRTSGALAVTDNPRISAPYNACHKVTRLAKDDLEALEEELGKQDVAAVILEVIQGVGGLWEASTEYYRGVEDLCRKYQVVLIADEVQSGYGRTGDFFAFQMHGIRPDIISMAKGMGNGFPVGGILIDQAIRPWHGMLGTTFGGNHLACAAANAVLDVLVEEQLMEHSHMLYEYVVARAGEVPEVQKVLGRGLMLGLEFGFEVSDLRKELLTTHRIFTGASANKNLLRILPPLTVETKHFDLFFGALKTALKNHEYNLKSE